MISEGCRRSVQEPAATIDPPNARAQDNPPAAAQADILVADKPGVPKEKESLPTGDDETSVGRDVESNARYHERLLKYRKEVQAAGDDIPTFLDRRHEIATPAVIGNVQNTGKENTGKENE
jgi:hypothetical protein